MGGRLRILWPGRTKSRELRALQELYLQRIQRLAACEVVETREARGLEDRQVARIKEIEAAGLEKRLDDDYIICLSDAGKPMSSVAFAGWLQGRLSESRGTAFVVGGAAGLAGSLLEEADLALSLSPMTFSHELCRVMLLEQIYRALTIMKGRRYAK
jgi:23S rRNA (pseudouridine1915-N3)-methyltransferase